MQQCPSCQHELTMKEQIEHPDSCPSCGIYFEKFLAQQAAGREARAARLRRQEEEQAESRARTVSTPVTVVDFDPPFWGLVFLLVKLTFAAIPAALIVMLLIAGATAIFGLLSRLFS